MKKETFQIIYLIIFLVAGLGLAGNFELNKTTSVIHIIILIITGILSFGKIIYWLVKGE